MKLHLLEREQTLPISAGAAWDFFSTPANLAEITPPDLGFRTTSRPGPGIHDGQIITYRLRIAPALWIDWVTEIKCVDPGRSFVDEQRFGPYRFWHHRHIFEEIPGGVRVRDVVRYALPFPPFGELAHPWLVRPRLEAIFDFRKQVLARRFGILDAPARNPP